MLTSAAPGTMIVAPINAQAELDASLLTNPMAAESMMNLNQPQFTFDMTMKSADMAGMPFPLYRASVNHWFSASASPSGGHNWFWRLAFRATDATSTSVCYLDARIYYDVVLFQRNVSDEDFARWRKPKEVPQRVFNFDKADYKSVVTPTTTKVGGQCQKELLPKSPGGTRWSEESDDDESMYAEFLVWKKKLEKRDGDEKSAQINLPK
jgi:hypothetical protein